MFVIVHDGSVILGPRPWNKFVFEETILEDCEYEATLPLTNADNSYIEVTASIKIYPVGQTIINGTYDDKAHSLAGPYWTFDNNIATPTYNLVDKPLDIIKGRLKERVAINRYFAEIAGFDMTVQSTLITIDTKREERNNLISMYSSLDTGDTIDWKFPQGWLTLTKLQLAAIILRIKQHVQECFTWEKTKSAEIDAATTIPDLLAINLNKV